MDQTQEGRAQMKGPGSIKSPGSVAPVAGSSTASGARPRSITSPKASGAAATSTRSRSAPFTIEQALMGFSGLALENVLGRIATGAKTRSCGWCEASLPNGKRVIYLRISGQPYSKANSRKLVQIGGRPRFIKSDSARQYEKDFASQCRTHPNPIKGRVWLIGAIAYESWRSDLDESLIMDGLQGRLIENDRQIVGKLLLRAVEPGDGRSVLAIVEL